VPELRMRSFLGKRERYYMSCEQYSILSRVRGKPRERRKGAGTKKIRKYWAVKGNHSGLRKKKNSYFFGTYYGGSGAGKGKTKPPPEKKSTFLQTMGGGGGPGHGSRLKRHFRMSRMWTQKEIAAQT